MHAVVWGWLSYAIRDDLRTGHFDRPQVLHLFESTSKTHVVFKKTRDFFHEKTNHMLPREVFRLDADGLLAIGTGHFDCGLCSWCR